jgi:hypothetical protein
MKRLSLTRSTAAVILAAAISGLLALTAFAEIGGIKPPTPFIPTPTGDGRAVAYGGKTFAPRCAVWSNQFGAGVVLTAWDVQCTRTPGYWKTHCADAVPFLPISLGGGCLVVSTCAQVETVLKDADSQDAAGKLRAQLLAAKLNVAMGGIPPADLAAIGPVIAAADALLANNNCKPDTGKQGADRSLALALAERLDFFNNKYAPEVEFHMGRGGAARSFPRTTRQRPGHCRSARQCACSRP